MTDNNIDVNIVPVKNGAKHVVVSILPLFTQGQKSHEFPNGLRLGNKE